MAILNGERSESKRSRNANAVDDSVSDTPKGSFPKSAHLLKHSDFQRVYQQGRRHFSGNMTVFYLCAQRFGDGYGPKDGLAAGTRQQLPLRPPAPGSPVADARTLRAQTEADSGPNGAGAAQGLCAPELGRVRIGFTVSKALGGAVERNRMRRRTREAVRRHLSMLHGIGDAVDVVINPKKSLLIAEFSQISLEVERAFRVIRQHSQSPSTDRAGDGVANRAARKAAEKAAEKKSGTREARRR
jgi:ribonuclease P protein component